MAEANDLIVIFLGLEILSLALYVLAAFNHKRVASGEASLKYFILGGFSSAIFLYGIALTYGATGSTNLVQIADFLSHNVLVVGRAAAGGARAVAGRLLLQGGGRPVPHVDAGRLSGLTVADHGLHGRGGQDRRVRGTAPGLRLDVRHAAGRLAAGRLRHRHRHPPTGRRAGGRPARHQAHARVLVDQPRRVRAARAGGRDDEGRQCGALLPLRLHVHGHRHVRDRHGARS